jgi:hypothetical protein
MRTPAILAALCGPLHLTGSAFSENADTIYTGGPIVTVSDAAPSAVAFGGNIGVNTHYINSTTAIPRGDGIDRNGL